ncbi:MAG: T9SS type A sorting domain-containing protein [Cytophagaceae bacterium]|nr:T9SS type A sorting domain-containing protein [Cytophagaceae bacterium]MDW8456349.1 T9SS type A sorting domain-containing protein [Cytophagaceae bacterium]
MNGLRVIFICVCFSIVYQYETFSQSCTYGPELVVNGGFEQCGTSGKRYCNEGGNRVWCGSSYNPVTKQICVPGTCYQDFDPLSDYGTDPDSNRFGAGAMIFKDDGTTLLGIVKYTKTSKCFELVNPSTDPSYTGDIIIKSGYAGVNPHVVGLSYVDGDLSPGQYHVATYAKFANCNFKYTFARTGNFMGVFDMPSPGTTTNIWCQNISVTAGTWYDFSAWYLNALGTISHCQKFCGTSAPQCPLNPTAEIPSIVLTVNGIDLGAVAEVSYSGGSTNWAQQKCFWQATSTGIANICIKIIAGGVTIGNDILIDDISFRAVTGGCTPASSCTFTLPITLQSFKVIRISENSAKIVWSTVEEKNVKEFVLLRSKDGANFFEVDRIPAVGNSNILQTYQYEDNNIDGSKYYYKLKAIDHDHKITYSNVLPIEDIYNSQISVFPNPARDKILVSGIENYTQLVLMDMNGKEFGVTNLDKVFSHELDVSGIPSGCYIMKLISRDKISNVKVVLY